MPLALTRYLSQCVLPHRHSDDPSPGSCILGSSSLKQWFVSSFLPAQPLTKSCYQLCQGMIDPPRPVFLRRAMQWISIRVRSGLVHQSFPGSSIRHRVASDCYDGVHCSTGVGHSDLISSVFSLILPHTCFPVLTYHRFPCWAFALAASSAQGLFPLDVSRAHILFPLDS